jgi:hypothetical protein
MDWAKAWVQFKDSIELRDELVAEINKFLVSR